MRTIQIRVNADDERNIKFLRQNGFENISDLIRDLIAQKVLDIQDGIERDKEENAVSMDRISVRENEIVVFGKVTPATREGMFRLIDEKRISILPDYKGFLLRY